LEHLNFRLDLFGRGFFCVRFRPDASYLSAKPVTLLAVSRTTIAHVLLHTATHRHVHAVLATWLTPIEASYIISGER